MRDAAVLAFLPDPFGLGRAEFVISNSHGDVSKIDPSELADLDQPVVTLEAPRLVAELRSLDVAPPKDLIDVGEALRLLRGKAKNDGAVRAADPWRMLKQSAVATQLIAAVTLFQDMFNSEIEWVAEDQREAIFAKVVEVLRSAWVVLIEELAASEELQRFEDIERPVGRILYSRQSSGIAVDLAKIGELVTRADHDKYTAYNRIADMLGVSPSGLTFRNVGPFLARTDAAHLAPFADAPNFEEYVRLAASHSSFAEQLVTLVRATRDLRTLARLRGDASGVARPEFQIMGTVTGRILVSNPSLQQMRKGYRDVIVAEEGRRLAYIDFAQFEPGILASLAGDRAFIERYNRGDIYLELALALFGDPDRRSVAKRMFLSFSYGMSPDRIVEILGGDAPEQTLEGFRNFISEFPGLLTFREAKEEALQRNGFVDTLLGNRRYRTGEGDLRHDERRWAVSQAVQGSASLIFKESLLLIAERLGDDAFLLPMHDAALLQLSNESYEADLDVARSSMLEALRRRCPELEGRVVVSDHF